MAHLRGQSMSEVIALVGLALLLVIPLMVLFFSLLNESDIFLWLLKSALDRISYAIERLFIIGCPSQESLTFFSAGFDSLEAHQNELVVRVGNKEMVKTVIGNVYGTVRECPGLGACTVTLSSFGDFQLIHTKPVSLSCDTMHRLCNYTSCLTLYSFLEPSGCCGEPFSYTVGDSVRAGLLIYNNCTTEQTLSRPLALGVGGLHSTPVEQPPTLLTIPSNSSRRFVWKFSTFPVADPTRASVRFLANTYTCESRQGMVYPQHDTFQTLP